MKSKNIATNWKEEPLLLNAKDLKRILRVNMNHVYSLFHRDNFPNIKLGKRYVIEKNTFRKWLNNQA
ncbi:MAG: helix-turn-helix domain-containing protein [Candidatus Woesearchaeota archaeon]